MSIKPKHFIKNYVIPVATHRHSTSILRRRKLNKNDEVLLIYLICVMLAEGARFKSIFNTLHEKWDPEEANQDQQAMVRAKKEQEATGIAAEDGQEPITGITAGRQTKTNKVGQEPINKMHYAKEGQEPTPTCRISAEQAEEVVQWQSISLSLLEWEKDDRLFWTERKQRWRNLVSLDHLMP